MALSPTRAVRGLIPEFAVRVAILYLLSADAGVRITFTSGLRTKAEQARLYQRFITGKSKLPAAPPGRSLHEAGRAVDFVVSPVSRLADVVATAQALGMRWGGERDPVHFELRPE